MGIRKHFCTERVVKPWNRLPREVVNTLRLSVRGIWTMCLTTFFNFVSPELVRQLD